MNVNTVGHKKEEQGICTVSKYLTPNSISIVMALTHVHRLFDTLPSGNGAEFLSCEWGLETLVSISNELSMEKEK